MELTLNIIRDFLLLPTVVAFLITLIATPIVIRWAWATGLVDNPQKRNHPALVHKKTTPRAGGLALYFGIVITALIFLPITKNYLGILLGTTLVVIVGILDDRYDISPYIRFLSNFVAAAIVIISGVGISYITNPLGGIIHLDQIRITVNLLGTHTIVLFADIFALIWIVWTMNMLNWSKGVDGQMPLIVIVAAVSIGLLSLRFISYEPQQIQVARLSFIIAGSTFAFLFFNWHPAKIFPGYSATILGFILAILSIQTGAKVATAILVLGVPTIDAIFTVVRRIYNKKSPFKGDRGHLHHKLLDMGWSHQKISLFYFFVCAILGTFAISLSSEKKLFALILVGIIFLGGILWLTFSSDFSNLSDHDNGSKT